MTVSKLEFKTEVKELLDLMIHSLYSHKEIFLRELISNASDAIDKARFDSLTNPDLLGGDDKWKIKVIPDAKAGTVTISDNGIGMTKDEIVEHLGTIAHSGTKEFIAAAKSKNLQDNPELIGQFGVGFYSAFMVADKVVVVSRKAGTNDNASVEWESTADGSFTIEEVTKHTRGTDVILHIKTEEKKFLETWELRSIIKKYSDYIEHPIVMDVEKEKEDEKDKEKKVKVIEEETINSMKAIWLKNKSEVSEEEYNEFYKHISHDFTDPARVLHYNVEGTTEFSTILYIPSKAPFNIWYKDYEIGLALYVNRVQIMTHCEQILPVYLRFLRGVVDSSDLPLNVSREILQKNRHVDIINKSITKKALDVLSDMKKNEYDKYLGFYMEFGKILKEGIHLDFEKREELGDLLLFQSVNTKPGEYTTLQDYIDKMPLKQKEIYYIAGTSREEVVQSPYLEAFKEKGYDVLFMLDEIDGFIMDSFEFRKNKFKSVVKGDIDLDKDGEKDKKKAKEKYEKLIELIKDQLKDDVKDVRLSGRLKDSACCIVADDGGVDHNMENILKSMGQEVPVSKGIFEINPSHIIFEKMNSIFEKDKDSELLKEYTSLLYDQALLLQGSKPKDTTAFAKGVAKLMADNIAGS